MPGLNVNNHALDGMMILTHRLAPGYSADEGLLFFFFSSYFSSSSDGKLKPSVCGDGGGGASSRDRPIVPDDNAGCRIPPPCALLMAISRRVSDHI